MIKPTVDEIGELLSQRSGMRPEEGYWKDFMVEFHHNQRVESVSRSVPSAFANGIRTWFSELSPMKWAYGAGLAYATAAITFFLAPRSVEFNTLPTTPVNHEVVPAQQTLQSEQPDLSPPSQGNSGEQAF